MTIATVLEFPGMTRAQYDGIGARLDTSGPPDGILYHACGPAPDGWRIMEIWESPETFDRFVDGVLLPAVMAAGGPAPSRREIIPTHHAGVVQRASTRE